MRTILTKLSIKPLHSLACKLYHDETKTMYGGTAILVSKNVEVLSERDDLNMPKTKITVINYQLENSWVEIKVKGIKKINCSRMYL